MQFTVILRYNGVDRTYHCQTYADAIVLRDALEKRYSPDVVELWDGATRY